MPQSDDAASGIYAQHYRELVGFLQRICADTGAAEDLAQEAGTRLIVAMRRETILNPRAYLFHVAANLARDHLRRQIVVNADLDARSDRAPVSGADHVALVHEQLALVESALSELPARAREVLRLARIEGLSQKEIAARLGIARKTVENHLTRALALLATRLRERDLQ